MLLFDTEAVFTRSEMGNQLTGIAPSQILPVEHYLQDVPSFEYETGLGSTRFFKVKIVTFHWVKYDLLRSI